VVSGSWLSVGIIVRYTQVFELVVFELYGMTLQQTSAMTAQVWWFNSVY